jgi:hypothetical protein
MVDKLPALTELTDSELDHVAAGQGVAGGLVAVNISDVANNALNNNHVTVAIPVNATVAAAVLGTAVSGPATQTGRIFS